MPTDRYVVAVLARPRVPWFRAVARWATSAAIPADVVRCVSGDELRAHLGSGRPFSAVLVDGALPAVDRDLLAEARDRGCAVVVVDDRLRTWAELGAVAVLAPDFDRADLLEALGAHARMVARSDAPPEPAEPVARAGSWRAPVVAVCGTGGTGASSVAVACAEGLSPSTPGGVVVADLCRRADQGLLHDVGDVVPGVQELVEIHRHRRPGLHEVRALTFEIEGRGHHVLVGLRRARSWSALRPRSLETAFDALRQAFGLVVCDVDGDLETEAAGGSLDVEERNLMTLTAVRAADVVLAVGRPGVSGTTSLVRLLGDLHEVGVPPERVVPVCNRAPRTPRGRAEVSRALAELSGTTGVVLRVGPLFLPVRRVEEALRDGSPVPAPLPGHVARAVRAVMARAGRHDGDATGDEPAPVRPGTLGSWGGAEAAEA